MLDENNKDDYDNDYIKNIKNIKNINQDDHKINNKVDIINNNNKNNNIEKNNNNELEEDFSQELEEDFSQESEEDFPQELEEDFSQEVLDVYQVMEDNKRLKSRLKSERRMVRGLQNALSRKESLLNSELNNRAAMEQSTKLLQAMHDYEKSQLQDTIKELRNVLAITRKDIEQMIQNM